MSEKLRQESMPRFPVSTSQPTRPARLRLQCYWFQEYKKVHHSHPSRSPRQKRGKASHPPRQKMGEVLHPSCPRSPTRQSRFGDGARGERRREGHLQPALLRRECPNRRPPPASQWQHHQRHRVMDDVRGGRRLEAVGRRQLRLRLTRPHRPLSPRPVFTRQFLPGASNR